MHNIDRTVGEANYEYNNENFEANQEINEYSGEFENQEMEGENEFLNALSGLFGEQSGEAEYEGEISGEYTGETSGEYAGELSNEALEMELATELLEVTNEAELEQFLGGLIKKAAGAVKNFANSSAGRALGGMLKSAAKTALPIVGKVAGTYFGGPIGGQIGGQLGSAASNLFEMELEGLSNEDKEFELSRAFVRFATNSVRQAVRNPRIATNPRQAVKSALVSSARRWAPGLLRRRPVSRRPYGRPAPTTGYGIYNDYSMYDYPDSNGNGTSQQASGTWYRQGNQIIINL